MSPAVVKSNCNPTSQIAGPAFGFVVKKRVLEKKKTLREPLKNT